MHVGYIVKENLLFFVNFVGLINYPALCLRYPCPMKFINVPFSKTQWGHNVPYAF